MRIRDLDRLTSTTYDVLVIGGGIHGLAVAYEAASRGLRAALIEADDFGSGASFNHQKTAHGGLRSLQTGRIGRARQSIRERRALARIAPWLLRPLPFIVGTYRSMLRSRVVLRAAFKLDEWLSRHRNDGVEPELHLPKPRLVSKAATLRLFPGIRQEKLTGGAQWYDYQIVQSERLTFAFAAAADRAGADLANHVEALEPFREGSHIAGVNARDRLTRQPLTIKAQIVVNAAGSRAGTLMQALGVTRPFPLIRAMNLLTSKKASDIALAAPTSSGRMLTLVPWQGRALVGTSQSTSLVQPNDVSVSVGDVDAFINAANHVFPALKLTRDEVTLVHRGNVPAVVDRDGRPDLRTDPEILDHSSEGADGAFTIIGTKYTTARATAERTTRMVARKLGKRIAPSRTAEATLPGAGIADHEALAIETARDVGVELPLTTIRHLIGRYAEFAADIVRLMAQDDLRQPVSSEQPTLRAEVVYAVRNEMALRLTDIIVRRTGLGAAQHPGKEAIRESGRLAAAELKWDDGRLADEIAAVEEFYRIDGAGSSAVKSEARS
jgi:glycerol-3-phosphate dehydrogenase